ncbi:GNAT family N-acetyltransferase [Streptomyces beihaiensis]|uniref:GNAT family N-acetyltransferase n=1 Tax=Streptomyces beihaiensis TaxID=2984495 RepID=UPI003899EB5B
MRDTWQGAISRKQDEPVGTARVSGDDGTAFQVVDIRVRPGHRGRGLGERISAALTEGPTRRAPATAYVSLIADAPSAFVFRGVRLRRGVVVRVGGHAPVHDGPRARVGYGRR